MQSADELLAKYSQRLSDLIPEEMPEEKTEEEATRADEAPVWEAMQAAEELPDEKSDEATRDGEVPVGQAVQSAEELPGTKEATRDGEAEAQSSSAFNRALEELENSMRVDATPSEAESSLKSQSLRDLEALAAE